MSKVIFQMSKCQNVKVICQMLKSFLNVNVICQMSVIFDCQSHMSVVKVIFDGQSHLSDVKVIFHNVTVFKCKNNCLSGTVFYSNSGTNSGVSNTGTLVGSVNTNIGSSQTGPFPQGTVNTLKISSHKIN